MSLGSTFALLCLATIGALAIVLQICALGRCNHKDLYWHLDHDKVVKRCNCGQRSEP